MQDLDVFLAERGITFSDYLQLCGGQEVLALETFLSDPQNSLVLQRHYQACFQEILGPVRLASREQQHLEWSVPVQPEQANTYQVIVAGESRYIYDQWRYRFLVPRLLITYLDNPDSLDSLYSQDNHEYLTFLLQISL